MDLSKLLTADIQNYINENSTIPATKLALRKNPFPEMEWISIISQIVAKAKAKDKLPTWYASTNIIYPSKISVEQTSSEKTAAYKSSLISGESLIDLTGGFGVDDYYFSKIIPKVFHCEINEDLSEIVKNNYKSLAINNIICLSGDSTQILLDNEQKHSWIYIDPSRRNDSKGKVFMLKDCLPNVPENLDLYFQKSNAILIKTAPLLDLTAGLNELNNVKKIHIVALENEVKELLWELHKEYEGAVEICTANILKDKIDTFNFIMGQQTQNYNYELALKYLYEPNSAIMKSGGFDEIASQYQLNKLHKHSHLYTSNNLVPFPGRIFKVEKTLQYSKLEMTNHLKNQQANITVRNFPETVENIRKKWKIKDGGSTYTFFTTDYLENKTVLICSKV
ncbi:class I SAM-dependent methyltransferase [Flavobacterium sp. 14A]|uniref:THUMP-like domain-containing protein n=1 Tax=Flavobacterium sp. 14A TaxID=2735896 RepID=UPI0015707B5B|nr:class I SAM-dependent methyltransferase [Flavobacterium sp. 14A]NRT13516.1 hypothetical protein [Flavobacterium sp. 14A]